MDKSPVDQREILIRYGRIAPNARDRILDQFYLIVPGNTSLYGYIASQCFALILGTLGMTLILSSIYLCLGAMASFSQYMPIALGLEAIWVFWMMRRNYTRRYQEKKNAITEIGLSHRYLRLHSRNIHGGRVLDAIAWEEVTGVSFLENFKINEKSEPRDCLEITGSNDKKSKLFLDSLQTIEERKILRNFFTSRLPEVNCFEPLTQLLKMGKASDVPFTKLWSQALKDSRPRLHTTALSKNQPLQNNRFVIRELIGGGGQGAVYIAEARDMTNHSQVVLKEYVLPDIVHEVEHKDACEQFEKEIHLLSKLDYQHVIKLLDAFVEDHRAYLVLEEIKGPSLKTLVDKSGPMPYAQVIDIAMQLLETLEYLHSAQPAIMHLDFSPENLLLSDEDRIILIDFNISAEVNSMRTRTVMGKQRYMAPEQYRGKPSVQSDIYAFGQTLYFLFTGLEPEPITVARTKTNMQDSSSVSDELDALIAKATALEEENRFQSAAEVKELLSTMKNDEKLQ